jgi:hypothetical protein
MREWRGGGVTWHHASGVSEGILLADIIADEPLVSGVVEGGPQVSWGEHLALADLGGLLHVQPLAVVLQQELVAAWDAFEGDAVDGTGPVDSHAGCSLQNAASRVRLPLRSVVGEVPCRRGGLVAV